VVSRQRGRRREEGAIISEQNETRRDGRIEMQCDDSSAIALEQASEGDPREILPLTFLGSGPWLWALALGLGSWLLALPICVGCMGRNGYCQCSRLPARLDLGVQIAQIRCTVLVPKEKLSCLRP
jgi:hypothetical protein